MRADSLTPTWFPRVNATVAHIYGGLFAVSALSFCIDQWTDHRFGIGSDLIAVAGYATCGWSWLVARALFRSSVERKALWPLAAVAALMAAGAFLHQTGEPTAPAARAVQNVVDLVSSAMLLLAAAEPLRGLKNMVDAGERRFRIGFSAGYVAILAVALIWVDGASAGSLASELRMTIKAVCALLAIGGMVWAVWRRSRHPLEELRARVHRPAVETNGLGDRLRRLMAEEAVYTRPSLKVADLARSLGEAEYKVTQCITGSLGFRNFNQMANHFRVEEAKQRLADPSLIHLPILTIAFDCGFASIGPFNRAFKAQTGLTPMEFRRSRRVTSETVAR